MRKQKGKLEPRGFIVPFFPWKIKETLVESIVKEDYETSSEDGGVSRHASPCTTTERTTTKPQNNTQNCQKIKLYGSLATKDLKKSHSFGQLGEADSQRRAERRGDAVWHGVAEQAVPHSIKIGIKIGRDTLGVRIPAPGQTSQPRVPVPGRYIPITSGCENQWELGRQKKLQDSQQTPLKGPAQS